MKLGIKERLLFGGIFPEKGDFLTQSICQDISEKIKLSEEEIKQINLRFDEGRWVWDTDKDIEKEVEFSDVEFNLLKIQVDRLDKEKLITHLILDICKKIKNA